MSLKINNKRFISIFITCLFLFSTALSVNVSAEWEESNDEGIWVDEFDNADDITLDKCVLNDGFIKLDKGSPEYFYDYNKNPKNIDAWYHDDTYVSEGIIGQLLGQYVNPDVLPGTSFDDDEIEYIGSLGGNRYETKSLALISDTQSYIYPPMHHFRFKIDQKPKYIDKVSIKWWFGEYIPDDVDVNLEEISMYVWSYGDIDILERWVNSGATIPYNDENINQGDPENPDPDIAFPTFEGDEYISEDGYIDILIMGSPKNKGMNSYLYTDYIKIDIESIKGYEDSGTVISSIIDVPEFGGWERVFWTSSKYAEQAGVTISILDENEDPIEGFESTSSPLDISEIEQTKIILKASLDSTSPKITPWLGSWGVLWQKPDRYLDTFSNKYRIEETLGVIFNTDLGKINVSKFYSNWEMFGKNPSNTRSYIGDGVAKMDDNDDYYWYTDIENGGGGFQSPVYSDGKVYVPSADKRIYVFNATKDDSKLHDPFMNTSADYDIETSLAVYENYLIFGTGTPGAGNKIYCLYKNNLTKKWQYPESGNEQICYYAPPVVDNGIVYITTWSGLFWDTPFLPFLNNFVGGNKLIAIDLITGDDLIWSPVGLPEGSFSAPAIGEGNVYVGCQKMNGKSLLAYDISSGEQVWNNSVGIIGRSGIVYGDGIVYAIANDKKSISEDGKNTVIAADAYDGTILWNKTIGAFSTTTLLNVLKGAPFFMKIIEGYAPISTPAYSDDTLFVLDPNGTFFALNAINGSEKWSYDLSTGLLSIFNHFHTSPVVVGDYVYVVSGNGLVHAFNTEYSSDEVEPVWTYQIAPPIEAKIELYRTDVLSSPIIADNLLFVSSTDDGFNLTGRLYCIGEYSENTKGYVTSNTLHVPTGYWWNSFIADKENTTENTVSFSILDENNDVIKVIDPYNDTFNDISVANSNGIKLHAILEINNDTHALPALHSWAVNWSRENATPEFDNSTFEPGEDGWVNRDLEKCSIVAFDNEDEETGITSGIDVTSGRFRIEYKETETGTPKFSDWIETESNDVSGDLEARITANLSAIKFKIYKIINISFTVNDLAGNSASSKVFTFKLDVKKPTSEILDRGGFESIYSKEVLIEASAEDPGTVNISGIDFVSLLYKFRNSSDEDWTEDWKLYDYRTPDIYSWMFGHISMESGEYMLITRAQDKASNLQDIDDKKSIKFFFDNENPTIDTEFKNEYIAEHIPTFTLSVSDDYLLESVEYRVGGETDWYPIANAEDIDGKTYTTEWTVPEGVWATWYEDGEYFIFFRITDHVGNIVESDTSNTPKITKNQNITDLFVDLSDFEAWQWDDTYKVSASIPDYMDVEQITLFYGYSQDNKVIDHFAQYGENLTDGPFEWDFKATNGSGYYSFYIRIEQSNGRVTTTEPETINVTLLPITFILILVLFAILFLLVTVTVLAKMKKKKNE